jgi:hypothetical protein
LIRGFLVLLPHVYPVAYKEWPAFEYLNSNYGATLGGLRDENEKFRDYSNAHFAVPETITLS